MLQYFEGETGVMYHTETSGLHHDMSEQQGSFFIDGDPLGRPEIDAQRIWAGYLAIRPEEQAPEVRTSLELDF